MIVDNFKKIKNKTELNLKHRLLQNNEIIKREIIICLNDEIEIHNKVELREIKFSECNFKNLILKDSSFYACEFSNCIFENIVFESCLFSNENENVIFGEGNKFINCEFMNCNLKNVVFKSLYFKDIKFINSNMTNVIIDNSYIENIIIKDCNWSALKCINSLIKHIKFKDDFITKFNEDTFFDKVFFNKSTVVSYEDLYNVYMTLASKFESNKLTKVSGEYYYLAKCEERNFLSGIDKIKSYIFWLLCGYGERPTYSLITSLEVLVIFTIIYMFTGISVNGELIKYDMSFILNLPIENFHLDFLNSLYFSIVTFTTVGYGDIIPVGIMSMVLSGIEMVIGITMAGVWTAILARKITR